MTRARYDPTKEHRGRSSQKGNYARGTSEKVLIENVVIGKETEKAMFVTIAGAGLWMPLSQVHEIHRATADKQASIVVSEWIAKQKGLR